MIFGRLFNTKDVVVPRRQRRRGAPRREESKTDVVLLRFAHVQ